MAQKIQKISEFMLREHGKILALLNKFEKSKNLEDFQNLRDKLENHMYAEEQAIFIFYAQRKKFPVLIKIMQQHQELEEDMQKIEKDLHQKTEEYKKLMKAHVVLEDTKFYPLLDKDLTSDEQKAMLETTKEYILGNIGFGK